MMNNALQISTPSDREIAITRSFNASRALVWDAHTRPELVHRWLLGPEGWTMPICEIDLRIGGRFRYVWRNQTGTEMGMGGEFREIVKPERIVNTEKFDESWYPGEAIVTTAFAEKGGRTALTLTVLYESKEARDAVLKSPMDQGLEAGYARLEKLLDSITTTRELSEPRA